MRITQAYFTFRRKNAGNLQAHTKMPANLVYDTGTILHEVTGKITFAVHRTLQPILHCISQLSEIHLMEIEGSLACKPQMALYGIPQKNPLAIAHCKIGACKLTCDGRCDFSVFASNFQVFLPAKTGNFACQSRANLPEFRM